MQWEHKNYLFVCLSIYLHVLIKNINPQSINKYLHEIIINYKQIGHFMLTFLKPLCSDNAVQKSWPPNSSESKFHLRSLFDVISVHV